jgi:hypothetical protein
MPYNDDNLIYDVDLHAYVITPKAVENNLGENIEIAYGGLEKAQIQLKNNSRKLYSWLYSQINISSKKLVEYRLAMDVNYRDVIFQALLAQVEYALESSADTLGSQHGINVEKGTAMNIRDLRDERLVSAQAIQTLRSAGLLYTGTYGYTVSQAAYRRDY